MFALQPISLSADRKTLTIRLYWEPGSPHGRFDPVDILKSAGSSRDLDQADGNRLPTDGGGNASSAAQLIKSGYTFVFQTTDPNTHPLPSFELLEMQWYLQRIV
ncbi:hypothetical protein AJ80_09650 [Polytolypa hystricis UAMH7299]|uniref:Uncharacterized protein n=1 Tax=Polytolypa hystricis (strain UAMH7299) TaxID=1447883 RepID=A0A2B7WLS4_POLH7|nr:hypothetical protein AJ80_09650 [Polytolypa hystricis UAMH7299]